MQDVFVRAWRSIDKLQHPEAIKPWLMTITARAAYTRLARRRFTRLFLPASDSTWVREIERFTGAHRHRNIRVDDAGVLEMHGP